MSCSVPSPPSAQPQDAVTALRVVNEIPSIIAYWDTNERCIFANAAYRQWFGKSPEEMVGLHIRDLLGPTYERNLPYIRAVLAGELQEFERKLPRPNGELRDGLASYTPHIVDGLVRGFTVHVTDVTSLRRRETALVQTILETIETLEDTKGSFRSKKLGALRIRLEETLETLRAP